MCRYMDVSMREEASLGLVNGAGVGVGKLTNEHKAYRRTALPLDKYNKA